MPHETALLATLAVGFALAFALGLVALRLRLPPLVGYLLAGVAMGPFTPGFVGDVGLAGQLAEVGVILLMFGVGLHFSPGDLRRVRGVAVPGALLQMVVAAALGTGVGLAWGWPVGGAVTFGFALSVASTVVVLRVLEARGLLDSHDGRAVVGWLVVEDFAMILVLVLLPALFGPRAGQGALAATIGVALAKVAVFVAVMAVVGRRAVPWLLTRVARTGSRELFTLAVLAIALGIAVGAAALVGVSLALGAFVAGMVISESDLSYQAAADALPLQDAFAVLFFVSVGMLFDPGVLLREPARVLATVGVVLAGNGLAALAALLALGHAPRGALTVAAALAQVGEFSFIVAGLGVSLGVLPTEGRDLVLAAAILTIAVNPLVWWLAGRADSALAARPALLARLTRRAGPALPVAAEAPPLAGHAIVVGHGRVGRTLAEALAGAGVPYVVVEQDRRTVETLRDRGVATVFGDATRPTVLAETHPEHARLLVVTAPDPYHARRIVELARAANPALETVVRTHGEREQAEFEALGLGRAFLGERELAVSMARHALRTLDGARNSAGSAAY